jgi:flagellar basal body rod protein FlgG
MDTLDMLANNLANASAPGYKADREFYNTYVSADAAESPDGATGSVMPAIERAWTDYSPGTLTPTGNPLDLSLRGSGFFVAVSPNGPLLTRNGNFRLSPAGDLETQDGYAIRGQDGKAIRLDPAQEVQITPEGEVRQDGQSVSRLDLVNVGDHAGLNKTGKSYFAFSASAISPAAGASVEQGVLESANVQPAESAVRLVSVMRQFEMLQRAANIGSDMTRRAIEDVAKVTG